jgi:pyridinium-3,5-biscarboxylic acid mononucleotide synthase
MSPERIRELLQQVKEGSVAVEEAVTSLRDLPFRDIGVATIDHHRALRQGTPEVVFGEGKSVAQLLSIAEEILRAGHDLFVTRIGPDKAAALGDVYEDLQYNATARTARVQRKVPAKRPCAPVAIVSAGTSDLPVAEEAAETLETVGLEPARVYDVGVAGLHRLLGRSDELDRASLAIVIAGMEGALPSVVGGLLACPVIAVPTSIGYGTALGGFTALFGMLSSCASGIAVVNIDNGFGAAMAAHRILPRAAGKT